MTQQSLEVPAVHCDHCVSSIEGAVAELEGVEDVKVDLEAKTVFVSFDEHRCQLDRIISAIEGQGYDVGPPHPLQIGTRPE